jgi:uncharacterized protein YdbL (DUF1318 family)
MFSKPVVTLLLLAGLGISSASWAINLQDAKAQGLVGEQPNGYLGLVKKDAKDEVKSMMAEINGLRKKEYQSIAQKNKTELGVVETLAGKKAIEMTPSGQFIKSPSGDWVKK